MDKFFLQLSELARAGWSLQIAPEPREATLPATRAVLLWSFQREGITHSELERDDLPYIDWVNLFAPEMDLRKAMAKMYASVFPDSPFGNLRV